MDLKRAEKKERKLWRIQKSQRLLEDAPFQESNRVLVSNKVEFKSKKVYC